MLRGRGEPTKEETECDKGKGAEECDGEAREMEAEVLKKNRRGREGLNSRGT